MESVDLFDNIRIMELRLAYLKRSLADHYGEEVAMRMLKSMSEMFNANFSFLVQIFNSPNKIINHPYVSKERKFQETIVMGEAYGYNRGETAVKFLNVSKGYVYQDKDLYNPEVFLTEEWVEKLDDSITDLGIPARYSSALAFLVGLKTFQEVV